MTDNPLPMTEAGKDSLHAIRLTFNLHGKEWTASDARYWTARIRKIEDEAGLTAAQDALKHRDFLDEVAVLEKKHGVRVNSINLEVTG